MDQPDFEIKDFKLPLTITNDIIEIYNVLGIEAARQAIKNEFS